jgi:large subunit ribosomal protein L10
MNRDEKREVVERLVAQIKEAKALIVTDYRGLTVTETADLRRTLREAGASFHVAKNTLAKLAAEQAERPTLVEFLEGPTAIAFIEDDPAAAAKKLSEVARSTKILAVKGGVMNGHTLTADQIRELGELPPRQTLLSQVVGAVNGPMQGTVGVLNAPLRDIVALLDAYIAKRQEAEAAA